MYIPTHPGITMTALLLSGVTQIAGNYHLSEASDAIQDSIVPGSIVKEKMEQRKAWQQLGD